MYHPDAFDPVRPVGSYWADSAGPAPADDGALSQDVACDVAIIGAGFTGLWAARRLAMTHGCSVRVFDAGSVGWGASGRNGGFACLGGTGLSYGRIIARVGIAEARRYMDFQLEALGRVRRMIGLSKDGELGLGPGEVVLAHRPGRMAELTEEQAVLRSNFGIDSVLHQRKDLAGLGMRGPQFHGALHIAVGFPVQPLELVYTLAMAARGAGARVHTHSPVTDTKRDGGAWLLTTPGGHCRADKVIIATNGYGQDGPPGVTADAMAGRMLPVQSNILVTRPLTEAEQMDQGWTTPHMAYDSRHLLHYFRLLPDGRFLFGGRGGHSAHPDSLPGARAWLTGALHRLFPAWRDVDVIHFWRGFACLASDRSVHLGALDETGSLWFGGGYHGNGVGMSAAVGPLLADLAAGTADPKTDVPALLQGPPPRFPLPGLRHLGLRAAYLWYGIQDALP